MSSETNTVLLALMTAAALVSAGCEARVSLGGACGPTVSCPSPYVCGVGGRCRVECTTSDMCPVGERCLVDVSVGVPACSIEAERCTTDCAAGLECVEGQCQSMCSAPSQCPDGMCSSSGTCVVPSRDDAGSRDAGTADAASADAPVVCAPAPRIVDVDVGLDEVCAVAEDGAVYCWGYFPTVGRDGDGVACEQGAGACFPRPVRVAGAPPSSRIAVGGSIACAIAQDQSVHCWGQLDSTSLEPAAILGSDGVALLATHVDAGRAHVCAITATTPPAVRCWGTHAHGVPGQGRVSTRIETDGVLATELGEPAPAALVLGAWDTFVLTATEVRAVGENNDSELGVTSSASEAAAIVRARAGVTALAASADDTCLLVGGAPRCWGRLNPILGVGVVGATCASGSECTSSEQALEVGGTELVGLVADPFGDSAMGWTSSGALWGWGSSYGSLLNAQNVEAPEVLTALRGRAVSRVSLADHTACAILAENDELVCWGLNDSGQLGRGTVQGAGEGESSRRIAEPPCW